MKNIIDIQPTKTALVKKLTILKWIKEDHQFINKVTKPCSGLSPYEQLRKRLLELKPCTTSGKGNCGEVFQQDVHGLKSLKNCLDLWLKIYD